MADLQAASKIYLEMKSARSNQGDPEERERSWRVYTTGFQKLLTKLQ